MNRAVRFSQVIARVIACSVLLVLPSCGIPGIRPPVVGPDLPPEWVGETGQPPNAYFEPGAELVPPPDGNAAANPGELPPPNGNGTASPQSILRPTIDGNTILENSADLGIHEFFNDPMLTDLIEQGMSSNRELLALNEEIEVARNEVVARRGAYLPILTYGGHADLTKSSRFTPQGAVEEQLEVFPGKNFPDPLPDFLLGLNLLWRIDIWRELRNARDAAAERYIAAGERRNFFLTRMIAEIAENYYELMALDKRLENLDQTILLQQQSLDIAKAKKEAARGNELAVQRFDAEVRKNQSEKLIVRQEIIEVENRINFLVNRYPQPVERVSAAFFDLTIHQLNVGVPAQLLQNRPDIRQAERELAAAGLDVLVARAHFFPTLDITSGVGYEAFNTRYLFDSPESLIYNAAGHVVGPLINKTAIRAEYNAASAKQLQSLYNYQRVVLNAFTEVVNRVSMVENYTQSIEIKKQQLQALEASVESARRLFQNPRVEEQVEYLEVLLAQRDLRDARMALIDAKRQQLSAIVNAYQALGGGNWMWNLMLP